MNTKHNLIGRMVLGVTLSLCLYSGLAHASPYPVEEAYGVIHEIDTGRQALTINGLTYRVALDARVEIDGSFGAYSMLREGQNVHFFWERHSPQRRQIIELRTVDEIPADAIF